MNLFGRDGFAETGIRAIAAQAGVSPGLVVHHFGSKDGLKQACDDYVARELIDIEVAASERDLIGTMQRWLAEPEAFRSEFDYLNRMILEGSETGDALFDALVDRTEQMLVQGANTEQMTRFSDPRAAALVVALMGLAPLVMSRHVSRSLGEDGLSAAAMQRLALPAMELYTHGLYSGPELLEATRAAMRAANPVEPAE